jgi:hypothetical protein
MRSNKVDSFDSLSLLKNWYVQLALILLTLLLFLITKSVIFALLIAIEIFGFVAFEVASGVKEHGWQKEIKETLTALLIALFLWFGAMLVFNTSSPISAVASCSMLPALERGDFVIVQGGEIDAYEINLTTLEFEELLGLANVDNKSFSGSIYSYCMQSSDHVCKLFASNPTLFKEKRGPFVFHYSLCNITVQGQKTTEPCVTAVEFKEKLFMLNRSHDVIVYQPASNDIYSLIGEIVHRAQFKINVNGDVYYLTKGDNNPVFDIQVFDYKNNMGNYPVPQQNVKGKVIARVPYLGYLKLFISGLFAEPAQCKTLLSY